MEGGTVTNEESRREQSPQNERQKLENKNLLEEKPSPNFMRDQITGSKEDKEGVSLEGNRAKDADVGIEKNSTVNGSSIASLSREEYENKVILDAVRLLGTPALPEEYDETELDEMSRLAPKQRAANKSISRPSLSKVPGELSGQPSVKNTKDDVKYWKNREQELLNRIAVLESKADATKDKYHISLDLRQEKLEDDLTATTKDKNRLQQTEKEVYAKQKEHFKEPNLKGMKSPEEIINHLRMQNEDLRAALAKMTSILRDKTALCVSQEKKVAALTNQVESLKEVVTITKDLLNIRNMEVQHISNDISAMESKIDRERQRHNEMLIKMDEAVKLNGELKKEYENQMKLFQHLRDNYEEKIRMITQRSHVEEIKEQGNDQHQNTVSNGKIASASGKPARNNNFKVNFHDT